MNDNKGRKKIALVTGGNRGLGYETCRQLAQSGLTVILGARDLTKGKSAAYQLNEKEGLDVIFYQLDVPKEYLQHNKRNRSALWTIGCVGQ